MRSRRSVAAGIGSFSLCLLVSTQAVWAQSQRPGRTMRPVIRGEQLVWHRAAEMLNR